jgi:DNA modification methylase
MGDGRVDAPTGISDTGGPSRFFPTFAWEDADFLPVYYQAKANKKEREAGRPEGFTGKRWNTHPTVKPVALMRWLVRLVTPPGGLVLDPFTGSGTTGVAAHLEGFDFIGVEKDEEYCAIASARIGAVCAKAQQESQQKLFHR